MNNKKGTFITLEGPDGSGKSTACRFIKLYLKKQNIPYVITREPGGTDIGEQIREILLNNDNSEMSNKTEALLYAAARAQHVDEKIKPLLDKGNVVISDRFVLSSLAYQGYARNLGINEIEKINAFAIENLKNYENNIIFFNIKPEISLERVFKRKKIDRLESEGIKFQNEVHKGYMETLKSPNYQVFQVNANENISNMLQQVETILKKILQ